MMHTCIFTLIHTDPDTRKVELVMCDGDQWTEGYKLKVPKKFPMPVVVDDCEFLDKHGRFPKVIEKCHILIGYEYVYDVVKYKGKFKLHKPVYLGEISCSSMNRLKRKPK